MIEMLRDYHFQWSVLLASSLLFFSFVYIFPKFGLAPTLLLSWMGIGVVYVWAWKNNRYVTINPYDQMALRYFAADSLLKAAIVLAPILFLVECPLWYKAVGELMACSFIVLNFIWIIISYSTGCSSVVNGCGGLVGNPSIGMGLMVCMLPILTTSPKKLWAYIAMVAIAVFVSKSSIALGLLASYLGFTLFPWGRINIKSIIISMLGFLIIMLAGFWFLGGELLNDSDRFMIWKFMIGAWRTPANMLIGTGLGTYHVFSINLQHYGQQHNFGTLGSEYWWNTLHNDPLQFLFEGGILGFVLFVWTYFTALLRSFKISFALTTSIVLYGLYMTLDPALHNPIPALFGAWMFVYALRKPEIKEISL